MVPKRGCQGSKEDDRELIDLWPPGKTPTGISGRRVRKKEWARKKARIEKIRRGKKKIRIRKKKKRRGKETKRRTRKEKKSVE